MSDGMLSHQALSRALMELRGDLVQQAQDDVKAHAEATSEQRSVQRLVDLQTKELQVRGSLGNYVFSRKLLFPHCFLFERNYKTFCSNHSLSALRNLQDVVEEKDGQLQKMRKDVKKYKDEKNALNTELEEARSDLSESESSLSFQVIC